MGSILLYNLQVLPPWTALHLPQIYLDIAPASKHLISISGFEGNLRQIVKQMILYTGAKASLLYFKLFFLSQLNVFFLVY